MSERTTKDRIIEAALETLKQEGFAGTSARSIARRGEFNQALIFYHFGTLTDLLLAALDRSSERRLAAYRAVLDSSCTLDEKIRDAIALYREDLATGHVTVLSEMIGGSLSRPDLGPEVLARMEPWIALIEGAVREPLERLGMAPMFPPRTVALAVASLSLGVNLVWSLDREGGRAEALIEMAERLARLAGPMLDGAGR